MAPNSSWTAARRRSDPDDFGPGRLRFAASFPNNRPQAHGGCYPINRDIRWITIRMPQAGTEAGVESMADEVWVWCEKVQAFGLTVAVQETRSPTFQDAIRSQSALRTASLCALQNRVSDDDRR
jgi:hypothetical protein